MKKLLVLFLAFVSWTVSAETGPKRGVWYGSIGEYPIMLCIEEAKAAYYYAGQSTDIPLNIKDTIWTESVKGVATGYWKINAQTDSNLNPDRIDGYWGKRNGKAQQFFELWFLASDASACSSKSYQQTLLIPSEPKLSLTLSPPQHVTASGSSAGLIKANGELWMWNKTQTQPKLMASDYVQIAFGAGTTLGIKQDGSLWGWGDNTLGQLGGEKISGKQPVHMGEGFVAIAANRNYSLALKKDGTLWAWGGLDTDAKGNVQGERKSKPTLLGKSFISISAGDSAYAAIKNDGTLWMWGQNNDGQLGIGSGGSLVNRLYQYERLPTLVGQDFSQVSVGYSHTAAIKKDGTLWTWGHESWGQLGNGKDNVSSPIPIKIGDGFSQVVTGGLNTAAIKTDGTLWLWGGNQLGLFGDCTTTIHNKPVQVGTDIVQAALGEEFLLAVKSDGSEWTWGWPWDGDQMDIPRACRKPARVILSDGINKWDKPVTATIKATLTGPATPKNIISIAAGRSHSAVVKADGSFWTWGNNEYGQLALGTTKNHNLPQQAGKDYQEVSIDNLQTLAMQKDGSFWHWGPITSNDFSKSKQALAPVKIFTGTNHLLRSSYQLGRGLGLKADGTILDWPYYWETSKQPIEFGHDVSEISARQFESYAIKKDGTLWQLAQYPINPPPRQIGNNFIHVVSNVDHSYGIKADGSLWAWGDNSKNQLGDGTQVNRADPVKIGTGFVQVAAGRFHGIALGADGSLWTWGNNEVGVAGDGTTITHTKPIKINTGFAKIAAGDYHNLALKVDGTLWAWGNNEDGQLGDGTNIRRLSPVQITTLLSIQKLTTSSIDTQIPNKTNHLNHAVTSIMTGLYYSCALFADSQIKCWGSNSDGQLGNDKRRDQNPLPIIVDRKAEVMTLMAMNKSRLIECGSKDQTQLKACKVAGNKYSFLRGATTLVNDFGTYCGLMRNGKIRCSSGEGSAGFDIDGINDAVTFDYRAGHGCAIEASGSVKCWGDNSHGELGNGTLITNYTSYRSVATQVIGLE